ncbi:hypothetical protein DM02DRAFT_694784 [Periconia macrospinosa]|uniref:Uncharacterized protein n=1 Tax=Periconia macrospinosa TaxID=97972 RepID=A0A2V1D731_9PLEO|nr:hypothetical protein DM02DRAFT_694784 [Periconia macrospinosa]
MISSPRTTRCFVISLLLQINVKERIEVKMSEFVPFYQQHSGDVGPSFFTPHTQQQSSFTPNSQQQSTFTPNYSGQMTFTPDTQQQSSPSTTLTTPSLGNGALSDGHGLDEWGTGFFGVNFKALHMPDPRVIFGEVGWGGMEVQNPKLMSNEPHVQGPQPMPYKPEVQIAQRVNAGSPMTQAGPYMRVTSPSHKITKPAARGTRPGQKPKTSPRNPQPSAPRKLVPILPKRPEKSGRCGGASISSTAPNAYESRGYGFVSPEQLEPSEVHRHIPDEWFVTDRIRDVVPDVVARAKARNAWYTLRSAEAVSRASLKDSGIGSQNAAASVFQSTQSSGSLKEVPWPYQSSQQILYQNLGPSYYGNTQIFYQNAGPSRQSDVPNHSQSGNPR